MMGGLRYAQDDNRAFGVTLKMAPDRIGISKKTKADDFTVIRLCELCHN